MTKCIISGCKIPARGKLKVSFTELEFDVCGVHRRILSEKMNEAGEELRRAHRRITMKFIVALDELGDHSAEQELALAE